MNNFRHLRPVRTVSADGKVEITTEPRPPEEQQAMEGEGHTEMGEHLATSSTSTVLN